MQIIPRALGQTEGALVFWDDLAEIGVALPRPTQVIDELSVGLGVLEGAPSLIVYASYGGQTLEVHLPRELPTSVEAAVDVWEVLWKWRPDVLRLRYGESPTQREREVTLLLPKAPGESLAEKMRDLARRMEAERRADALGADQVGALLELLELMGDDAGVE